MATMSTPTFLKKPKSISSSKAAENAVHTVDEFIRQLANDQEQVPLLAYPTIERSVSKCEYFTGRDLDRFVDAAAKYFIKSGLNPVVSIMKNDLVSSILRC